LNTTISTQNSKIAEGANTLNNTILQLKSANDLAQANADKDKVCEQKQIDTQSTLDKANANLKETKDQLENTSALFNKSKTDLLAATDENTKLTNIVACSESAIASPDYTSNQTISKSLSDGVGDNDGS
jgi:hypothetical protein